MKTLRWVGIVAAPLLLAACATSPENEAVSELQRQYDELAAQEPVRLAAPSHLLNAEEALDAAAEAGDEAEREHQLYLARQYLALAETAGERRGVQQQLQTLAERQRQQRLQQAEQRSEQLEAELAALEAKRTERGVLITLDDVFFETARANIPPGAADRLGKLADYLEEHPDQAVIVEGHTDSRGPEDYNRQLSEERAESVKQAMVARGISADRIRTRGLGESRPVASNETSGGRQLNRRVEVVLPSGES